MTYHLAPRNGRETEEFGRFVVTDTNVQPPERTFKAVTGGQRDFRSVSYADRYAIRVPAEPAEAARRLNPALQH
jgi:hypothetical protein